MIREDRKLKLDARFITHVTKGEHYMISTGDKGFNGIVKNNDTAAFIIECLKNDTAAATTSGCVFTGISMVVSAVLMTMLCACPTAYSAGGVYCTSSG